MGKQLVAWEKKVFCVVLVKLTLGNQIGALAALM